MQTDGLTRQSGKGDPRQDTHWKIRTLMSEKMGGNVERERLRVFGRVVAGWLQLSQGQSSEDG